MSVAVVVPLAISSSPIATPASKPSTIVGKPTAIDLDEPVIPAPLKAPSAVSASPVDGSYATFNAKPATVFLYANVLLTHHLHN